MINLSLRTKTSLKVALSLVIAYGISLYMNWANPYWAAFAIIFTSLSSIGQSLAKAGLRILGTVGAAVVAMTIMGMFPQSRWLFMIALSLYIFFCAYMMTGESYRYFYQVAGFVTLIICLKGGINTSYTFQIAILRLQQTVLGVVVATAVGILIWPEVAIDSLTKVGTKLFKEYSNLFVGYNEFICGEKNTDRLRELRHSSNNLLSEFSSYLSASTIDTMEISLCKSRWRYFEKITMKLAEEFELWRECVVDLKSVNVGKAFSNISVVNEEILEKLEYVSRRFSERTTCVANPPTSLEFDLVELRKYQHSERALLEITKKRLDEINLIVAELISCVDNQQDVSLYILPKKKRKYPSLDWDRLISAFRVFATIWVAFLIWINIRIPGETGYITMGTSLGMAFLTSPKIPVANIIKPALTSCFVASLVYIFVIPQLSSFYSLGPLLFGFSFLVCYIFGKPSQALSRTFGLAMVLAVASISNQQHHNFLIVATMVAMFGLILLLLVIMSHVPTSMYPGNVTVSLIDRFWKCAGHITAPSVEKNTNTFLARWGRCILEENLIKLPEKIKEWIPHIDNERFPEVSMEQLYEIDELIKTVSMQLKQVFALREVSEQDTLMKNFAGDFAEWDVMLSNNFTSLECSEKALGSEESIVGMSEPLERISTQIGSRIVASDNDATYEYCETERVYRMLGHYNCISASIVKYRSMLSSVELGILEEFRL